MQLWRFLKDWTEGEVTIEFGSEFQALTTRLKILHPWWKDMGFQKFNTMTAGDCTTRKCKETASIDFN